MYQKILIIGNLGGDPEARYTPSGAAYTRFSVAVNRKWQGANGEAQEETTWYRCTAWGKQAEACAQYLRKGSKVLVESDRLYASPYLNRDNQPAASLELTARVVRFLSGTAGQNGAGDGVPETEGEGEAVPF
jgi:single-strand DNA-binding protein